MLRITRIVLSLLILSVVLSAIFGIWAILSGEWGWYEVRILLTTITISGASICALACAALGERKNTKPLPFLGISLTLLGAGLMIWGIWSEVDNTDYWKLTVVIVTFAIATSHLSLLSLAHLSGNFQWAMLVAYLAIYGLAAIITGMIVAEEFGTGGFQLMGVASIVVASVTILIPIFHRLSASLVTNATQRIAKVLCPCCGIEQEHLLGEITCPQCQSVFVVKTAARKIERDMTMR